MSTFLNLILSLKERTVKYVCQGNRYFQTCDRTLLNKDEYTKNTFKNREVS